MVYKTSCSLHRFQKVLSKNFLRESSEVGFVESQILTIVILFN